MQATTSAGPFELSAGSSEFPSEKLLWEYQANISGRNSVREGWNNDFEGNYEHFANLLAKSIATSVIKEFGEIVKDAYNRKYTQTYPFYRNFDIRINERQNAVNMLSLCKEQNEEIPLPFRDWLTRFSAIDPVKETSQIVSYEYSKPTDFKYFQLAMGLVGEKTVKSLKAELRKFEELEAKDSLSCQVLSGREEGLCMPTSTPKKVDRITINIWFTEEQNKQSGPLEVEKFTALKEYEAKIEKKETYTKCYLFIGVIAVLASCILMHGIKITQEHSEP